MRICLIFLLLVVVFCCSRPISEKNKIYYIYNSKSVFKSQEICHDTDNYLFFYTIKVYPARFGLDSTASSSYILCHYFNHGRLKDSTFVKQISYLDSIDFYGTEWLKKKENLDEFWITSRGWPDSIEIYLFEPIKGTDSLLFRKVHRSFNVSDD